MLSLRQRLPIDLYNKHLDRMQIDVQSAVREISAYAVPQMYVDSISLGCPMNASQSRQFISKIPMRSGLETASP